MDGTYGEATYGLDIYIYILLCALIVGDVTGVSTTTDLGRSGDDTVLSCGLPK